MQLSAKENKGKKLTVEETELQKEVCRLVEPSLSHRNGSGIFSWRIKSLKKLLSNKVIRPVAFLEIWRVESGCRFCFFQNLTEACSFCRCACLRTEVQSMTVHN
jgi:hypothetical protein